MTVGSVEPSRQALAPGSAAIAARPRSTAGTIAVLYALAIVYVSTVLGPGGFNFTATPLGQAWHEFLATSYVVHGSDQRSDWNGNLAMFLPLGALLAAAFWPRRAGAARWPAALLAFLCCLVFLLAVKFAQLWFPPRTVTINYILAQSLGSLLGIALYAASRNRMVEAALALLAGGREALSAILAIYSVALFAVALFPFNFALSASDLAERLPGLPQDLFSWPLAGRPASTQLLYLAASMAAIAPFGMLIALRKDDRPLLATVILGFLATTALTFVQVFILSAAPHLVAIVYRTLGTVAGAAAFVELQRRDITWLRPFLARLVPVLAIAYLLTLLVANNLAASHWRSPAEAMDALDPRGLLPFWNHYIVSKSQAMQSTVVHAIMFAPVGVLVWLRRGEPPGGGVLAASLAAPLAIAIEIGRWFRPGLEPDFTNAIIAAAAAAAAVRLSASGWRILESVSHGLPPANRPGRPRRA